MVYHRPRKLQQMSLRQTRNCESSDLPIGRCPLPWFGACSPGTRVNMRPVVAYLRDCPNSQSNPCFAFPQCGPALSRDTLHVVGPRNRGNGFAWEKQKYHNAHARAPCKKHAIQWQLNIINLSNRTFDQIDFTMWSTLTSPWCKLVSVCVFFVRVFCVRCVVSFYWFPSIFIDSIYVNI